MVDGKINYLVDNNKCGKNSPEANSMYRQLCYNEKINKVAVYGLHPVARIIASFVIGLDPKGKQRFFKTEEQARLWLDE
ncbi:MAG: STAS/SEC14 domain-containing protein [Bacteroidetes bacterium]|nr:STAS/SEC14 domain-containing protein [Bacteroidota bacterium]